MIIPAALHHLGFAAQVIALMNKWLLDEPFCYILFREDGRIAEWTMKTSELLDLIGHQAALVSDENANDEDYSEILQGLLQLQADKGVVEDEDAIPEWEDEAVTFVADELLTSTRVMQPLCAVPIQIALDFFPAKAVFSGEGALTRVVTVRGRTNAVLGLLPVPTDDAVSCARALADMIPARGLAQVQHVSVDNPSSKLFQEFRLICPNLQIMTLDSVHLAMTWEYASSRKRTAGSKTLRKILSKFTATDDSFDVRRWGRPYDGTTCAPLTYEEARVQRQIQDCSMREKTAQRLLRELDPNKPVYLRIEWIKSLAAVASIYREEV
ncbi:unnamed protein product, partial [Symbiodinium sp. KB8]